MLFSRNKLSSVSPLAKGGESSLWDRAHARPLAAEPGDLGGRLPQFGLSPRRDCRVSPTPQVLPGAGLVSVALTPSFLASPPRFVVEIRPPRWVTEMGVTHYAALWSSDFPPRHPRWRGDSLPGKEQKYLNL